MIISLDGMGGDFAPDVVVEGAKIARTRYPDARFIIFGDEAKLSPLLEEQPDLAAVTEIRHTTDVVMNDDKASFAVRRRRESSMWHAIQAVKNGDAHGVVSGGNTGALMAMALFILRPLDGVDRPAIASVLPTSVGETVMLDLGANVDCTARHLVQFAVMGTVFARIAMDLSRPKVGLLNIGEEDLKGTEALRDAADILRNATLPMDFQGFIEGNNISMGGVDVVVTDGFTGNVALKTVEGAAKFVSVLLNGAFRSSWLSKLGYLLARPALNSMRKRIDPSRHNGGIFMGLNGICVKSHGSSSALGYAHAIGFAIDLAREDMGRLIHDEMARIQISETQTSETLATPEDTSQVDLDTGETKAAV